MIMDHDTKPKVARRTDRMATLLAWAIGVRILIGAPILNSMYSYTDAGGTIAEKIHPGSYLIFIVVTIIILERQNIEFINSTPFEHVDGSTLRTVRRVCVFSFACVIAILFIALINGQTTSIGFLIDSLLMSIVAIIGLSYISETKRLRVARIVIFGVMINAIVVVAELALQSHIFPYPDRELVFRPAGMVGHPLLCGLYSASAITCINLVSNRAVARDAMILFLVLSCFAAGARTASAVALVALLALIIHGYRMNVHRGKVTAITMWWYTWLLLSISIGMAFIADHLTITARLSGDISTDASILARLEVYEVFNLLRREELLIGVDQETLDYLLRYLRVSSIESPVVSAVLTFGIFGAVIFGMSYVAMITGLFRVANTFGKISLTSFIIIALSNNTLTTKVPALLFISCLVVGIAAYRGLDVSVEAAQPAE